MRDFRDEVGVAKDHGTLAGRSIRYSAPSARSTRFNGPFQHPQGLSADNLIGKPGETGALQEMWGRLGERGAKHEALRRLSIQQSDRGRDRDSRRTAIRVQDDLNVIRAKQLPLLQQERRLPTKPTSNASLV